MFKISDHFDLEKTIASRLFEGFESPWQILGNISSFILSLGERLPEEEYEKRGENIWIARDAFIYPSAYITGPCIIDHGASVRHCAFIRGNVIVGKNCVVGNSTELKNCVLFDGVEVPHYNYVGDSVLGYKAHLGAGAITSNVKSDRQPVVIKDGLDMIETKRKKVGAMIGDYVEVGCGSVLNPGTCIGRGSRIYPLTSLRGCIPANSIVKAPEKIVPIVDF